MKSEETLFNSQPIGDNSFSNDFNPGTDTVSHGTGKRPTLVQVGAAGVSGLVIGAVGMTLTSAAIVPEEDAETEIEGIEFEDDEELDEEDPVEKTTHGSGYYHDGEIEFAQGVNDDMSFSEAFAAARAEVGPGGAFEWHGTVYGTYTAAEWNAMTPEEQADFGNHFNYDHLHTTTGGNDGDGTSHDISGTNVTHEHQGSIVPPRDTTTHGGTGSTDPEIEVVSIVQDAETGQGYVEMSIDGHESYFIDQDGDGVYDVLVSDLNDNGDIDEGEMADISGEGLTVDMVSQATGMDVTYINEYEPDIEGEDPDIVAIDDTDDTDDTDDLSLSDEDAMDI